MYRKSISTLCLLFFGGLWLTLDAQTATNNAQPQAFEAHCKSLQDVVARERCIAETGITYLKGQLKDAQLTVAHRKDTEIQIKRQQEKIARLDAMSESERKQMQTQYDRAQAARNKR